MGERFLAIYILAGVHRGNGLDGVPMVRCGNANSIDVITGNQLTKINIGLTVLVLVALVGAVTSGVPAGGITVRNGHTDNVLVPHEPVL